MAIAPKTPRRGRPTLDDRLAALNDATRDLASETARASLHLALADASPHLRARAARILADGGGRGFEPQLAAALDDLLGRGATADPGCRAKLALAEALDTAEHVDGEVFDRGARHQQPEWVGGQREDTATGLRGRCLFALARLHHRALHVIAVDRLAAAKNPIEWTNVARALTYDGAAAGALLLRWMVREAPRWPAGSGMDVAIASLAGYFALEANDAQQLARELLAAHSEDDADPIPPPNAAEIVAQAIVETPTAEGCALLVEWLDGVPDAPWRLHGYNALALMRRDDAITYLLQTIASGTPDSAEMAVAALAPLRHDASMVRRAKEAAAANTAGGLTKALAKAFGSAR